MRYDSNVNLLERSRSIVHATFCGSPSSFKTLNRLQNIEKQNLDNLFGQTFQALIEISVAFSLQKRINKHTKSKQIN